jgi:hypothetical protein
LFTGGGKASIPPAATATLTDDQLLTHLGQITQEITAFGVACDGAWRDRNQQILSIGTGFVAAPSPFAVSGFKMLVSSKLAERI